MFASIYVPANIHYCAETRCSLQHVFRLESLGYLLQPRTGNDPESTLRAAPNTPHSCLQALLCEQTSMIAYCILIVEYSHVEHGASQVLPGLFHSTLLGMTLEMQVQTLTTVNMAVMVHNRPEVSLYSDRASLGGRSRCLLAHKCLHTWLWGGCAPGAPI